MRRLARASLVALPLITAAAPAAQALTCSEIHTQVLNDQQQIRDLIRQRLAVIRRDPDNVELINQINAQIAQLEQADQALEASWRQQGCDPPHLPPDSQTKPSDGDLLFFLPGQPDPKPFTDFHPLNKKPGVSRVVRGVVLRGWLLDDAGAQPPDLNAVRPNIATTIGVEDVHYTLLLDPDFVASRFGGGSFFAGVNLPGNPAAGAVPVPLAESSSGGVSHVTINSFWLPNAGWAPLFIPIELNAWHATASHRCGTPPIFCAFYNNFDARGPAPAGWILKNYVTGPEAADNWFPWDPNNPDGRLMASGAGEFLRPWDYVEVTGQLYEDLSHGDDHGCWGTAFPGHAGWLEIHPPDLIVRVPPPPGPRKEVVAISSCAPQGSGTTGVFGIRVCPEGRTLLGQPRGATPTGQTVHFQQLDDPRFTNAQHTLNAVVNQDCLEISGNTPSSAAASGLLKSTFIVWWT